MSLEVRFTLPDQDPQTVAVGERILLGTLFSNDVVLRAPGVEPIHAMVENVASGDYMLTDLGSEQGVILNGRKIEVESKVVIGDVVTIGSVKIDVLALGASAAELFQTATTTPPVLNKKHAKPTHIPGAYDPDNMQDVDDVEDRLPSFFDKVNKTNNDEEAVRLEDPEDTNPINSMYIEEKKGEARSSFNHAAYEADTTAVSRDSSGTPTTSTPPSSMREDESSQHGTNQADLEVKSKFPEQAPNEASQSSAARRASPQLFSPKKGRPGGDVLEVVSYWGDTVLEVELFHPSFKGYEHPTIGDLPKAHFLSGSKNGPAIQRLAKVGTDSFKLQLSEGMHARIRKGGRVGEKKGKGAIRLGPKDIAHVASGPIKYFLMYVKPPVIKLPRQQSNDPFFLGLMSVAMLFYFLIVPAIYLTQDNRTDDPDDDIWSVVNLPEKQEKPKPVEPPKPKKPKQKIAEAKQPPVKPKPPKPMVKPPKPIEPKKAPKKIVEKPKQTKKVAKPVTKPTKSLTQAKVPKKPGLKRLSEAVKNAGVVTTGAKKPDFKAPGKVRPGRKVGLAGGARGGGKFRPNAGGARKGKTNSDVKGVEGGVPNKASGVNLSKLGLGAGKILSKTGAGAIRTNFKSSAGGVGGGSGSASKTYGLGGPGTGRRLGVSGAGGAVNNFGGFGGNGSGAGGRGGLGSGALGGGFGRNGGSGGRADVAVPAGDPVVSGGLTAQEVAAVIRANLNQIRHCYEQLLQRSPSAAGKIKVNFKVVASGRVGSVAIVQSSIRDSIMKGCVTGKVRRWKFPKPRGGQAVDVNYPFVFNPL